MEQDEEFKSGGDSVMEQQNGEQQLTESQRAKLMRTALHTTVDKYISHLKLGWFAKAYPDLYTNNQKGLRYVHQAWSTKLKEFLDQEIQEILAEQDLMQKISHLDQIRQLNQHRKGTDTWRPSGIPSTDLEDHFLRPHAKHLENLEAYLHKLKAENSRLKTDVQIGRADVKKAGEQAVKKAEIVNQIFKVTQHRKKKMNIIRDL